MNLKLSKSILAIVTRLSKFRSFAILLAMLAIVGYTGYQISVAVSVTPTVESLAAAKQKLNPTAVKFDMRTIDSITQHAAVKVSPDLGGLGTSNPFYGQ